MAHTVIGMFDTKDEAQQAVDQLMSSGFTNSNVDISSGNSSDYTSTGNSNYPDSSTNGDQHQSGIGRFFSSLFGSDDDSDMNDDARTYTDVAHRSGSIVTVHADSVEDAQRAAQILDTNGAIDVHAKAEQIRQTGTTGTRDNVGDREGTTSVPIIEEQLQVGKKVVETGGARIRSRIVERPVEENLRLREETVRVERNQVDRPATDADFDTFRDKTVELREQREVPVVNKEARVVEEVSLSKEVGEREETVRDTVRKTEVDVENLGKDTTGRRSDVSDTDDVNDRSNF